MNGNDETYASSVVEGIGQAEQQQRSSARAAAAAAAAAAGSAAAAESLEEGSHRQCLEACHRQNK